MEISPEDFHVLCRACLTESNNMKSLFTELENAGGQLLLDLLKITANIEFKSGDAFPKQVCSDCESFLYKAEEFRKRCKESEAILANVCSNVFVPLFVKTDDDNDKNDTNIFETSDMVVESYEEQEKPDLSNLLNSSEISLKKVDKSDEKHEVKTEIGLEIDNEYYTENFGDREEYHLTVEFEKPNLIKIYKCCGEEYRNKYMYKEHIKSGKCMEKIYNTSTSKASNKNELACPKCDQMFETINTWSRHQLTHANDSKDLKQEKLKEEEELPKVQCSLCLRQFKNKKTLTKHIKRHNIHKHEKYVCTKCKREFKYKAFLESHMISVHAIEQKNLEVHLDSDNDKKKNVCPICKKSFVMTCTLKDHVRVHTGEKPFLCSICGKGFSQKTNLGQHMRRHMGVKPYKCDTCDMKFVSKGELDSHTRKHTGAHPFICDECGSGFTTSSALVKHRRTHTGERPYSCDLCHMKFAATGTLKNHRRTHTGERPYQCSHCEKSFVQRSDLISHIRCHTGERPFVCPQCGQAFRKAAAMKAHVKMHAREAQSMSIQVLNALPCDGQM